MQRRDFQEQLRHEDEEIQVDRDPHRDRVDPAPGRAVDELAADQRPDQDPDRAPRGPLADRVASLVGRERGDDDREV